MAEEDEPLFFFRVLVLVAAANPWSDDEERPARSSAVAVEGGTKDRLFFLLDNGFTGDRDLSLLPVLVPLLLRPVFFLPDDDNP